MKTVLRLWHEETGAILSSEVMLVSSILVIGVICGLASLRDSVTTELADLAQALGNVNQSYSFSGTQGHHTFNGGGQFITPAQRLVGLPSKTDGPFDQQ